MLCSVVIPVYNEEDNIQELYNRLVKTFSLISVDYEIIFVDDGSTDTSFQKMKELSLSDKRVFYLSFTRNFGHEAASTAGLDVARGDAVVLMDADLQDPPELIPEMIKLWENDKQLVYAKRRERCGETIFKKITAKLFYRLINLLSSTKIPLDTGDFRLMDKTAIKDFRKCREQNRFVRGLTTWIGYKQASIEYDRPERKGGKTKYNPFKLFMLSLDVISGFSLAPLYFTIILGFAITTISFLITFIVVLQKLFFGISIPGYALLASGLFFLGGIQILLMGIIGEYIGKIYRQVQGRPLYLIREQNINS